MAETNGGGRVRRYARRSLQVVLGLACGLGLAEAAFWVKDGGAFPHLNVYQADAQYGVRLRPGATTRIQFGGSAVTRVAIHGGGFRGSDAGAEPPVQKNEWLFVGDSQAFGLGVEWEQAFPARVAQLAKAPVYNAGVPTWGPPEFLRTIRELGGRRHPSTVVYVVNFANDPFEAERSNANRHAVWDGWAVRRETAPASVLEFPGRTLLFQRSHLVFALRQWWHRRGTGPTQDTERGTPSEGTFHDLFELGKLQSAEQGFAREETARRAGLYEVEATYAQERYRLAESRVRALVWKELKLGGDTYGFDANNPGAVYLAADANPGDIVTPGVGEEGRPVFATAVYVRQAVELRNKFERELRARAQAALDEPEAKQILSALSERDQERLRLAAVRAKPLEIVRALSPLTRKVLEAQRLAVAQGARFALLVLPLDVMVSDEEWPKHGTKRLDLAPARVLIEDLVESVRQAGGTALDATSALAAAEPGAFLPGDIHLTPKGHDAVARAVVEALAKPATTSGETPLALTPGRSRVPPPDTWTRLGGEIAVNGSSGCPVTKKYREWLYIRCFPASSKAPRGVGLQVLGGDLGDSLSWVQDGEMTLVAPVVAGQSLEALFSWSDGKTKRLRVQWDAAGSAPDLSMALESGSVASMPGDPAAAAKICACYQSEQLGKCGAIIANADASCVETYGADCKQLLACAEGNPLAPPRCAPGSSNAGATLRCRVSPPVTAVPAVVQAPAASAGAAAELRSAGAALIAAAQSFVGDDCKLGADDVELISVVPYDRCPTSEALVKAYETTLAAFEERAGPAALAGAAGSFREKARAFAEFTRAALQASDTRGTAALLQDLSLAYNAWQPDKPVPVDAPRMVALYFGVSGVSRTDYFRNLHRDGPERKAAFEKSGKHLIWRRGPNGFEGPYLEGDGRVVGGYGSNE
jgi:hypothetical protein